MKDYWKTDLYLREGFKATLKVTSCLDQVVIVHVNHCFHDGDFSMTLSYVGLLTRLSLPHTPAFQETQIKRGWRLNIPGSCGLCECEQRIAETHTTTSLIQGLITMPRIVGNDIDHEVEQYHIVLIIQPSIRDHYSVHHYRYRYRFCIEKLVMPSVYVDNFKTFIISERLWLVYSDTSMISLLISIVRLEEMRISKFSICHIVFHLWPTKDVFSDSWHTV